METKNIFKINKKTLKALGKTITLSNIADLPSNYLNDIILKIDEQVSTMPTHFRFGFNLGIIAIEYLSMLTGFFLPFSLLNSAKKEEYLKKLSKSRLTIVRALSRVYQGLCSSMYYSLPSIRKEINYTPESHILDSVMKRKIELLKDGSLIKEEAAGSLAGVVKHGNFDLHTENFTLKGSVDDLRQAV